METTTRTITAQQMLNYLQTYLDAWLADKEKYGMEDRTVQKDMDRLLGCKSMVETLIHMPVNLTLDGTVTIGY